MALTLILLNHAFSNTPSFLVHIQTLTSCNQDITQMVKYTSRNISSITSLLSHSFDLSDILTSSSPLHPIIDSLS